MVGLIAFLMVVQSKLAALVIIPGAFIGAAVTVGSGTKDSRGYVMLAASLVIGAFLGYLSETLGAFKRRPPEVLIADSSLSCCGRFGAPGCGAPLGAIESGSKRSGQGRDRHRKCVAGAKDPLRGAAGSSPCDRPRRYLTVSPGTGRGRLDSSTAALRSERASPQRDAEI
ncbi:MAG: DUF1097 domain-containing protein [Gemmatimonadales bacterium]